MDAVPGLGSSGPHLPVGNLGREFRNPILPIIPNGGAPIDGTPAGDENELATNDPELDEGETNDTQDTVDQDVREATAVNDHLEE